MKFLRLSVSVRSMGGSSLQILAIFLWKQTISPIINKNESTLIKYAPNKKWIHDLSSRRTSKENHIELVVVRSQTIGKLKKKHKLTIYFDPKNTFIHKLFSNDITSQKLLNFIYSKWPWIVLIIIFIPYPLMFSSIGIIPSQSLLNILYRCAVFSMLLPFCFILLLSVNRRCVYLITHGFEFWFKIYYVIQWQFWSLLYYWYFVYDGKNVSIGVYIADFLETLCIIITVNIICLCDGLQILRIPKIVFTAFIAVLATIISIYYTFYSFLEGEDISIIHINFLGVYISSTSMIGSSTQIIAIFMWKQVIHPILNKNDLNRCILIRYTPRAKWINANKCMNSAQKLEMIHTLSPKPSEIN